MNALPWHIAVWMCVLAAPLMGSRPAVEPEAGESMTTPAMDAEGLVVTLTGPARITQGAAFPVSVVVSNPTDAPRVFCRYHTPFEGLANDIFSVVDGAGNRVQYRGMMAKRAPPGAADFIRLAPGAARSAAVDLAEGYAPPAGTYQVRFRGSSISGLPDSAPLTVLVAP